MAILLVYTFTIFISYIKIVWPDLYYYYILLVFSKNPILISIVFSRKHDDDDFDCLFVYYFNSW